MVESVLISMDRGYNKENTVLGCRHHRSLVTSLSSSPKTPLRHSDVDFHDVFGGPPRRLSNQATRYSFGEGAEPSVLRGDGGGVLVSNPWTGLSEKPVFGEDSGNRRRYPSEDFFDDIFRGDNSVSSSPKAHDRGPFFSSSPGSLVLSPVVPLPPPQSEIFGASSNPAQLSTSPPSKVTRAMDFPSLRDPRPADGTSYQYSPSSRFSNQAIQGQDGLKNDPWPSYRQSRLSHEFSLANDESPNLTTSNRAVMGENLENGSNSSTIEVNSTQSHFSLYKWATKGVPFVIPLRRVNSSRIKVKSKTERCSSANGRFEKMVSELPEAALQDVEYHYPFDDISATTKSFRMELEKQKNETRFTTSAQDGLQECQIVEEVALAIPNPEPLSGIPCRIEDDADSSVLYNGRTEGKPYSLAETGLRGKTDREISELAREVRNPELKTLRLLLHETEEGQGNSDVAGKDGGNESKLKTTKKSSENLVPESAKNQGRKETASDNAEVDKASLQQSPRNSEDSLGRNGAKGKVREFVKIFNQEASSKPITNSEPRSQSSRWKNSGPFRAEKGANVSATEAEEQMHVDNTNRNKMVPDASVMVDEIPTKQKRQYSGIKTATRKSSGTTYVQTDGSAPVSEPGDSEAVHRERQDSFQGNFVIKELAQEQINQLQIGEDHDEIQVSDAKIRKWLRGKEGNIRSLLSTLQYVLWPESGWKPVPLVDIIEGNAVKRAYQKALLCLHPDKLQQKGAALHQKYIAEKVFDSLQEAWTHFNSLGSF